MTSGMFENMLQNMSTKELITCYQLGKANRNESNGWLLCFCKKAATSFRCFGSCAVAQPWKWSGDFWEIVNINDVFKHVT